MEFEIYTKEVELNGKTYTIRPLSGRFLPKLYSILRSLQPAMGGKDATPDQMLEGMDEDTVANLHKLSLETLRKSYPNTKEDVLDEFVSQNLIKFLEILITVNLNNEEDAGSKRTG